MTDDRRLEEIRKRHKTQARSVTWSWDDVRYLLERLERVERENETHKYQASFQSLYEESQRDLSAAQTRLEGVMDLLARAEKFVILAYATGGHPKMENAGDLIDTIERLRGEPVGDRT